MIEQIVPLGLGSPYHIHHSEDEEFYVLEGEIRFFSDGNSWVLGPGGFEGFVAELSSPAPPAGPPDMGALMEAAGRYGVEIRGPLPEYVAHQIGCSPGWPSATLPTPVDHRLRSVK